MRVDNFPRYVLLHSTSGDPNMMVRRVMRTSCSDSDVVTGLELWKQMAVTYVRSAQTQIVALLKEILTPAEWNPERSPNVLQMYRHWLKLISKYEALKLWEDRFKRRDHVSTSNVKGPLANALSLSINEKSTWSEIRNLLINCFTNNTPSK